MEPVYQPAVVNKVRYEGDTNGIGFTVPPVIPLAGLKLKYTVWGMDGVTLFELTTEDSIAVVDQHVDINFTHLKTNGKPGYYNHKCECFTSDFSYNQTLFIGFLTINEGA